MILGILLLALIVTIKLYVENTKNMEYIASSNILYPIIISLIIPWLIFEYKFKRQREFEEIKEKLKVYTKLYELLNFAINRPGEEGTFEFTNTEIKEIRKIFYEDKHLLSPGICDLWTKITNNEENKQLLSYFDGNESGFSIMPLKIDKKLLDSVKKELNNLQTQT